MISPGHQGDSSGNARWQFVQSEDSTWRWHRGANGDAAISSAPFDSFGRCLGDAIKNGFRPDLHPYSTRTGGPAGSHIDWSLQKPSSPTE